MPECILGLLPFVLLGAVLLAPLMLGGALYAALLGHVNTLDSGVTAFLTGTIEAKD